MARAAVPHQSMRVFEHALQSLLRARSSVSRVRVENTSRWRQIGGIVDGLLALALLVAIAVFVGRRLDKQSAPKRSRRQARATPGQQIGEEISVVGESFYRPSFDALRAELDSEGSTEKRVTAELRIDPTNPHSRSGKAVKVLINGHHVGYIPEVLAPQVFDTLTPRGGSATVPALLYLDDEIGHGERNSVTVLTRDLGS